jgi:hypothetical protein
MRPWGCLLRTERTGRAICSVATLDGKAATGRRAPGGAGCLSNRSGSTGRAQVNPQPHTAQFTAGHEPTGTGWPGADPPAPRHTLRDLRRGGEWSTAALLFAFVCWGVWAISNGGDLTTPVIVFVLSVVVAGGLFALARLVGRIVLEKQFHRVRRSARGAHLVSSVFLIGVGVAHLQQTAWVMTAFHWVLGVI